MLPWIRAVCLHRPRRVNGRHDPERPVRHRCVGVCMPELPVTHGDLAKWPAELEETIEVLALNHDTFSRNTRNQLEQVFERCVNS